LGRSIYAVLRSRRLLVLDLAPDEVEDLLGELAGQERQHDPDRRVGDLHGLITTGTLMS
jgi:hypothetical protein